MDYLTEIYYEMLSSEYPKQLQHVQEWMDENEHLVEECGYIRVQYVKYMGFLFGDLKMMKESIKAYKEVVTQQCDNPSMITVFDEETKTTHHGNDEAFRLAMEGFMLFQKRYDKMLIICIKTLVQAKKLFNKIEKNTEKKEMNMMSQEDIKVTICWDGKTCQPDEFGCCIVCCECKACICNLQKAEEEEED